MTDTTTRSGAPQRPDEGLRERKKRQCRQRIHAAAVGLVAERGLDRVTIEEIAETADVSPRTFFNYFSGKDAAVIGSDPDLPDRLAAAIAAQPSEVSPLECLRRSFVEEVLPGLVGPGVKQQRWQVLEQHPHLIPTMLGATRRLESRVAEALAERMGLPAEDPYPLLVASCSSAAVRVALESHRRDGLPAEEALRLNFDRLAAGLVRGDALAVDTQRNPHRAV